MILLHIASKTIVGIDKEASEEKNPILDKDVIFLRTVFRNAAALFSGRKKLMLNYEKGRHFEKVIYHFYTKRW